ncbi:uncharacterized protein LOC114458500 isoform X2 [Gouania willdenowi]|uniref:uncharacterized protein LOC114458500 isoform X2 n=1 Tax=Gouania willdenowi TaxID=441366 RepID=UPI0010566E99|nr:uncharacterized protein LOC114458500 isoform X2 [Gouania willdenowi]
MLSSKLLVVMMMMMILLASGSTAPVDEKEPEEVEEETMEEGEGELSEEEDDDDDDDTMSQDQFEGPPGVQQSTAMAALAAGGSAANIQSSGGASHGGPAGGAIGGAAGFASPGSSAFQSSAGSSGGELLPQSKTPEPDGTEPESEGNGHKLLNGGGASSQSGSVESSNYNVWLSLTGGLTPPTQRDTTDQSEADLIHLSLEPHQSQHSLALDSSHSTGGGASPHRELTDGNDSPDVNGNGRLSLMSETHTVIDLQTVMADLHTNTGGVDSVTHSDITGVSHDVTGIYSPTDMVTMATGTVAMDTAAPAVTDQTAGSITEQYNPSGQGPEGAENVELEDSC